MKINYNFEGVFSKTFEKTQNNVTVDSEPFEYNFSKSKNYSADVSSIITLAASTEKTIEKMSISSIKYILVDCFEATDGNYNLQFSIDDGTNYIDFNGFMVMETVGVNSLTIKNPTTNTISFYITIAGD